MAAEQLLKEGGAKAVAIQEDYTVFEAKGKDKELNDLFQELGKFGLIEYVRSSRIAILKSTEGNHEKISDPAKKDPIKEPSNNDFLNHKNMIFEMQ